MTDLAGLMRAHDPLVRRAVRRHLARWAQPCSDEDVEDLAQEVWLTVFCDLHRFRGESAVTTWLWSVARCVVSRWVRAAIPRRQREGRHEGWHRDPDLPERVIAQREILGLVRSLSAKKRRVVELVALGMSAPEIAARLGIPTDTVRTRLWHARRELERASSAVGMGNGALAKPTPVAAGGAALTSEVA